MKTSPLEFAAALHHETRRIAQARAMKKWPAWQTIPLPTGLPDAAPGTWSSEFRRAHNNTIFVVLERPLRCGGLHAMISSLPNVPPPTWAEKQRIKDTIYGARWAVEAFPPRARLVDAREAYHLYVYPPGAAPPLDLKSVDTTEGEPS